MQSSVQTSLFESKSRFLAHLRDFMRICKEEGGDAGYTDADIATCGKILDDFIHSMILLTPNDEEQIRREVKATVVALNTLNEKGLIETREREMVCDLVEQACIAVGFHPTKDITEEWRKW